MKRILCFGDSNTWGHDPLDGSRLARTWTDALIDMLPEYKITADGKCGRTTDLDVPDTPDANGLKTFREKYASGGDAFGLIIMMLGTNDLLNYFKRTAEETAEVLRTYAKVCRTGTLKNAELLFVSPIHIRVCMLNHPIFKELYSAFAVEESKRFAMCISRMAEEEGAYFLDAAAAARASDTDGIHMTQSEHERLAKFICDKIRGIL